MFFNFHIEHDSGNKSLVTTLFMTLVGICFIIISIGILFLYVNSYVERMNIKNNGIQVTATVSDITSYDTEDMRIRINYVVNNNQHTDLFKPKFGAYSKGDHIIIYCLEDDPTVVYNPSEVNRKGFANAVLPVMFFASIGVLCLKTYNIFKYKKEI